MDASGHSSPHLVYRDISIARVVTTNDMERLTFREEEAGRQMESVQSTFTGVCARRGSTVHASILGFGLGGSNMDWYGRRDK